MDVINSTTPEDYIRLIAMSRIMLPNIQNIQSSWLTVGKDTAHNIRATREFVINVVNEAVAEVMNVTAIDFPPEVDELDITHLSTEPSIIVKVPRISAAPASLECREITTLEIGRSRIILGQVVAIHVKDEFVDQAGPCIRAEELHAIGRMNGLDAKTRSLLGGFAFT